MLVLGQRVAEPVGAAAHDLVDVLGRGADQEPVLVPAGAPIAGQQFGHGALGLLPGTEPDPQPLGLAATDAGDGEANDLLGTDRDRLGVQAREAGRLQDLRRKAKCDV